MGQFFIPFVCLYGVLDTKVEKVHIGTKLINNLQDQCSMKKGYKHLQKMSTQQSDLVRSVTAV